MSCSIDSLPRRLPFLKGVLIKVYFLPTRFARALKYYRRPIGTIFSWLLTSNEIANFTYDLSNLNLEYLVQMVSVITARPYSQIRSHIDELRDDTELRNLIRSKLLRSESRWYADREVHYGRRLGWYALIRAIKPKVVVETGVDKGLGAAVILRALQRNSAEGHPGYYYGTDILPDAGSLIDDSLKPYGRILLGDSVQSLRRLKQRIDVFINDSDHSPNYEAREYATIRTKLSRRAVILGDNSHDHGTLSRFATELGFQFLFFGEQPANHWYPGGGIGFAFKATRT